MGKKAYIPLAVRPDADSSFVHKKMYDIAYAAQSESQKLDLYFPNEGTGPFPTILYFHGGGFCKRDKKDDQCQGFLYLTKAGYAVASCNYRLTGESIYPTQIQDAKAAVRYLRANAEKYQLDATKFVAAGQSAGGYLAIMVAATAGIPFFEDLSQGNADISSSVQACVDWFAGTDFEAAEEQLKSNGHSTFRYCDMEETPNEKFFGVKANQMTQALYKQANPLNYVTKEMPPTLIQHGAVDHLIAWQQSQIFAERIAQICGKERVRFDILPEADHDDPLFLETENIQIVRNFLNHALHI